MRPIPLVGLESIQLPDSFPFCTPADPSFRCTLRKEIAVLRPFFSKHPFSRSKLSLKSEAAVALKDKMTFRHFVSGERRPAPEDSPFDGVSIS